MLVRPFFTDFAFLLLMSDAMHSLANPRRYDVSLHRYHLAAAASRSARRARTCVFCPEDDALLSPRGFSHLDYFCRCHTLPSQLCLPASHAELRASAPNASKCTGCRHSYSSNASGPKRLIATPNDAYEPNKTKPMPQQAAGTPREFKLDAPKQLKPPLSPKKPRTELNGVDGLVSHWVWSRRVVGRDWRLNCRMEGES